VDGPAFNQEYLKRLAVGDQETAEEFFAHFSRVLGAKLRREGFASDLVEDIRQETMCRVLRLIRQGTEIERLGPFVVTICNNIVFESRRSQQRYQTIPEDMPEIADTSWRPEHSWVTHDTKKVVKQLFDTLPSKDQALLRGLFLEERDKDEMCRELGVDREYLRVLVHRAKSRARVILIRKPPAR
jgi:RNA polymerase sigma-70 factor, ECF subfamily